MFRSKRVRLADGRIAVVRRARPRDARAVITHVNKVGAEGVFIMTERLRRSPKEEAGILRKMDGTTSLFVVALIGGEIVGSADIARGRHQKNLHTAELGIALQEAVRGIGLGTAIMRMLIEWARSVGVRKLTLGVFASNAPARALYRKLGFTQEGRLRGQVILGGRPVDELLLAKWL